MLRWRGMRLILGTLNDDPPFRSSSDAGETCLDLGARETANLCPGICAERYPSTLRPSSAQHKSVQLVTRCPNSPQQPLPPPRPFIHNTPPTPPPSPRPAVHFRGLWEQPSPAEPVKGRNAPPPTPEVALPRGQEGAHGHGAAEGPPSGDPPPNLGAASLGTDYPQVDIPSLRYKSTNF